MEFPLKKKKVLGGTYPKKQLDIAYKFSARLHKEMGPLIKAIVLFGSSVKSEKTAKDIDILVILDDTEFEFTREIIHTYRIIVQKIVASVSEEIHLTSLKFTNFWEYVRNGDPLAVNILRDGKPILDKGFIDPLQRLLVRGRIRPSKESVYNYLSRAPMTLLNSQWHIMQAVMDLYWAVIDSAHAALMSINEIPPSPEHVSDMIQEKLVKPGLLNKKYVKIVRNFYSLSKMINHRDIKEIPGHNYDQYYKEAFEFVDAMRKFVEKK